jgi:hypothetical protein
MGCYICGNPNISDNHHIWMQAAGGQEGPTVDLCPNCHSGIHREAVSRISKKSNKKNYFTDDQRVRAEPLIQFIVIAMQRIRDNPNMAQPMNLVLKTDRQLMTILHVLKADAGFSNMNDFCLFVLKMYAKAKL